MARIVITLQYSMLSVIVLPNQPLPQGTCPAEGVQILYPVSRIGRYSSCWRKTLAYDILSLLQQERGLALCLQVPKRRMGRNGLWARYSIEASSSNALRFTRSEPSGVHT